MKSSAAKVTVIPFARLPKDYATLCRKVWLPRPVRDRIDYETALAAVSPFWGFEKAMTPEQAEWFEFVTELIADWEDARAPGPVRTSSAKGMRLQSLLENAGLTPADLSRLLGLSASMGSKLVRGERQLTTGHIRALAAHFHLAPAYFLEED